MLSVCTYHLANCILDDIELDPFFRAKLRGRDVISTTVNMPPLLLMVISSNMRPRESTPDSAMNTDALLFRSSVTRAAGGITYAYMIFRANKEGAVSRHNSFA